MPTPLTIGPVMHNILVISERLTRVPRVWEFWR